jgi:FtsP/CotA-like multicopper oxidase with cupredoxin domain
MSKKILLIALAIAILAVVPANAAVRNLYIAATDGWAYLPTDNTVAPQTGELPYYIRGFCDDVDGATAQPGCATFPAPIIDVTQGDDVFITLRNIGNHNPFAPEDPHTIHLHGMHVTSQNDGFSLKLPGRFRSPARVSTTSARRARVPTCGTATSRPPSTCRWACTAP